MAKFARDEITEYKIYTYLSEHIKGNNSKILLDIAKDEKAHYEFWSERAGYKPKENKIKIFLYSLIARIMGFTFAIKMLEGGEGNAQKLYSSVIKDIPNFPNT